MCKLEWRLKREKLKVKSENVERKMDNGKRKTASIVFQNENYRPWTMD